MQTYKGLNLKLLARICNPGLMFVVCLIWHGLKIRASRAGGQEGK